jgi:hypothetical protein
MATAGLLAAMSLSGAGGISQHSVSPRASAPDAASPPSKASSTPTQAPGWSRSMTWTLLRPSVWNTLSVPRTTTSTPGMATPWVNTGSPSR